MLYVCENNGYGEYTPQRNHQAIVDVADRAAGYGMPGVVVDGMDAVAVYEAAGEAIARARAGDGPTLLEVRVKIGARSPDLPGMPGPTEEWGALRPVRGPQPAGPLGRLVPWLTGALAFAVYLATAAPTMSRLENASQLPESAIVIRNVA